MFGVVPTQCDRNCVTKQFQQETGLMHGIKKRSTVESEVPGLGIYEGRLGASLFPRQLGSFPNSPFLHFS